MTTINLLSSTASFIWFLQDLSSDFCFWFWFSGSRNLRFNFKFKNLKAAKSNFGGGNLSMDTWIQKQC